MRGGTPLGCPMCPFINRPLSRNYPRVAAAPFVVKQGAGSSGWGLLHLLKIRAKRYLQRQTEALHAGL